MKSQSTHFSPPEWKVKVIQFNVWHLDQCSVDLKTGVPAVTTILFAGIGMYSPFAVGFSTHVLNNFITILSVNKAKQTTISISIMYNTFDFYSLR